MKRLLVTRALDVSRPVNIKSYLLLGHAWDVEEFDFIANDHLTRFPTPVAPDQLRWLKFIYITPKM